MGSFSESVVLAAQMVWMADSTLLQIIGLSLAVSSMACVFALMIGLVLGAGLATSQFRGRAAVLVALNTFLALPSVVVGLVVYLMLSRAGPLGAWGLLFTPPAMVIAQTILVVPLVTALVRQTLESAFNEAGQQLRSLGATKLQSVLILTWNERKAFLTLGLVAFGRAISEVGAVMIVGGNIDGVTRVMTTAIALETSKGDLPLALALGFVLLSVVLLINVLISVLQHAGAPRAIAQTAP